MRQSEYRILVNTRNTDSLKESIFITLFHSFGLRPSALHLAISLFQLALSCLTIEQAMFPFGSWRKSLCCKGRLLPVLKILFIHWEKRSEKKAHILLFTIWRDLFEPMPCHDWICNTHVTYHMNCTDYCFIREYCFFRPRLKIFLLRHMPFWFLDFDGVDVILNPDMTDFVEMTLEMALESYILLTLYSYRKKQEYNWMEKFMPFRL